MPARKIVINASPLILLFNSDLEYILPRIFQEILVTDAVWQEVLNSRYSDKAAQNISDTAWLQRCSVNTVEDVVRWDLGDGETEVLSYAFLHKDYVPVIDDMAAKKCASSLALPTLGTGSLLILAKEQGYLDSVETALITLRKTGMWISDAVLELLKKNAGE